MCFVCLFQDVALCFSCFECLFVPFFGHFESPFSCFAPYFEHLRSLFGHFASVWDILSVHFTMFHLALVVLNDFLVISFHFWGHIRCPFGEKITGSNEKWTLKNLGDINNSRKQFVCVN